MNPAFHSPPRAEAGPARDTANGNPSGYARGQSAARGNASQEAAFSYSEHVSGDSHGAPFGGTAYAGFERQVPWHQQSGPLHRNPVSRAMLMAAIFAVGGAVGLAATWWMGKPVESQQAAAVRKFEPARETPGIAAPNSAPDSAKPNAANGAGTSAGLGGPLKGVRPGELPYDGKPPEADENAPPAAALASSVEKTVDDEIAKASQSPSGTGKAGSQAGESVASVVPAPKKTVEAERPRSTDKADKADKARKADKADERVKASPAPSSKPRETKVAKAAPKPRQAEKAAKDREIERIQQQADDELKKKSRNGDVTEATRGRTEDAEKKSGRQASAEASSSSGAGSKRAALARCEREEDSLIGREWCKWKACKGMWGKNGCPSYEQQASTQY